MSYWKKKMQDLKAEEDTQDDYWKKKMAELQAETSKVDNIDVDDDIAPVRDDTDRSWFQKGAFEDGYQFGDLWKTVASSSKDAETNVMAGILGIGEKVVDAGATLVGGVGGLFNKGFGEDMKDFVKKDLYDEEAVARKIVGWRSPEAWFDKDIMNEENSVLGEKTDALAQSGGQLLGTAALYAAGVPADLTMGVTAFGSETENAFNQDASYGEAIFSGLVTAGAEILTEKISGGIKFGGTTLDDALTKNLVTGISNTAVRGLTKLGLDVLGEGAEEVLSEYMSALGQKLSYEKEETWNEILTDPNALGSYLYSAFKDTSLLNAEAWKDSYAEAFVGGALLGGVGDVGKAVDAKWGSKRDMTSRLTAEEEKVFLKEYNDRLAEAQKGGKTLTSKEKDAIYDSVMKDLEEGGIDTDKIESVLGGDAYKAYKDTVDSEEALKKEFADLGKTKTTESTLEMETRYKELQQKIAEMKDGKARTDAKTTLSKSVYELVKDSKLAESYHEVARRGQKFNADLTKYKGKQAEIVKKAMDSGVLNNTRRSHQLVEMVSRLAADKGISVDFLNNKKLAGTRFAVDGKVVNGYLDKSTNTIGLNVESNKYLNSVVGHEVTHVIEGFSPELYTELQGVMFKYAQSKHDYDGRRKHLEKLYKAEEIDSELTADLVGDYLFTDSDFVSHLHANNRNIFQKIYDEIKYLCKIVTAGSKEARELERVKHTFENALHGDVKVKTKTETAKTETDGAKVDATTEESSEADVKHSLSEYTAEEKKAHNDAVLEHFGKTYKWAETGYLLLDGTRLDLSGKHDGAPGGYRTVDHRDITDALGYDYGGGDYSGSLVQFMSEGNIRIVPEIDGINLSVKPTKEQEKALSDFISHARGEVVLDIDDLNGNTVVSVEYPRGTYHAKVLNDIREWFDNGKKPDNPDIRYSLSEDANKKLNDVGLQYDAKSETVSYSMSSLEDAFNAHTDENGVLLHESDYQKARDEYVDALAKSIAVDKGKPTAEEKMKASKYLDGLFLIHDMIAADKDRLDYEAAVDKSAWVSNSDYGGSIDFSTLCAKRRLFTGTFDAIQNALPDTVLDENDFLKIRDMLLEKELESPCSMCYVEGSRAKHGVYVDKWLKEYLKTNPEWKPQIADFTSSIRLERTRIEHPEAYAEYQKAMNKLAQRKPKEASVRTDYKGEILVAFADGSSVEIKNQNGGIRFNSFSDFEIIHALDCMQVLTDMARVGLNGQAYTKVKEFAESFGDTGLKINLSLVAKDVDTNGKLVYDEVNGMKYAEAMDIRNKHSDNVGTVIVVFNDAQLKAALADSSIDFVLPFHRSQWKKSQYAMMGLPVVTKDYTAIQNDRIKNPKTGRPVKLSKLKQATTYTNDITGETFVIKDNIMPNMYWDYSKSGRDNANRYLDYINANGMTPKFDFLLEKVDGKWTLPEGAVGDGYFKLLIDFKMYNNEGWGAPQNPVIPEFNMPYIQQMLKDYTGGHQAFPVAHDVVSKFVESKKNAQHSLSFEGEAPVRRGNFNISGDDVRLQAPTKDVAPIRKDAPKATTPVTVPKKVEEVAPAAEKYEAIKPKPTKEPSMKRVKDGEGEADGKQRKWVGTSTESDAVDGKVLPDDLNQEAIHYQPISNEKTLSNANARLNSMGYENAVTYFNGQFTNKKISVDDIVLGERLIQEAIKRGDTQTAGNLIEDVSILGTELGQKVQALSIIKRLTPEGQLRMLRRIVERGKTKGDKAFEGVEITQEMIDHILKTYGKDGKYDQKKLNEAVEDVKKKIADQMKVTTWDKVNAWRYLSMLGNPKTHIRNIVSNVAMRGTLAVKNAVARTIESVAPIGNRTKTWKAASEEVKAFSEQTAVEMKDVLSDGGKYNEEASIKAKREIFKNKVLNRTYNFNSDLLSNEDWWFSKPAFTSALSEFLTANGITTAEDIKNNPKIVAKAKKYATDQSLIATFRQYSWLANKINDIEKHNAATGVAVGAVLPFKKTPINIAKTALAYSPLGFTKTLTYDIAQVKNGKMEASELIDHLSQNITGTALTLVGYLLASAGFINGAGEDDKEGEYDYQLGEQSYSINIGDATFSLSWLSPIAMPLFVGANAFEQLVEGEEWNGDVVVETLAQTLDPLSEMSFLSSLDSVLSSYDSGIAKFAGIAESAAQNYITQFVPTLSSQVATVMDDTKRTTKVAGDSGFKFFDETINNLKYKIPFLRETLEPSIDIWGNEVKQTEDVFARAFETFIAPYSKREDIATEIDEEIKSLYSMTGDNGLIPSIPYNYVNYKNEKYEMSASEYTAYKKTYGQVAYSMLEELFDTQTYQNASADERAELVNKVYDYASDLAKKELLAGRDVAFTNAKKDGEEYYKEDPISGAIANDMFPDEYTYSIEYPEKYAIAQSVGGYESYKTYSSELYDIKADKDEDGKSISGSRKDKVIDYVNSLDIDYGARLILFKSEYKADDSYNEDIINYLDNHPDISYEQMVMILKELGFTVSSDGVVSWD